MSGLILTISLKKILKLIVPIAFGLFLVVYSYHSIKPEERQQILYHITHADPFWIVASVLLGILSHISRAIRWNYLLAPLGYRPRLMNRVFTVLMSYFANLGIPRSGEVLRATALATYEHVPFEKGFGTIVTERIIDLLMLFLIIGITLVLQTEIIVSFLDDKGVSLLSALGMLCIGALIIFLLLRIIRNSKPETAQRLKKWTQGLWEGLSSIFRMKNRGLFLLHTIFIWAAYIGMFWMITYTVPETVQLSLEAMLVAFLGGALAMTTTNGGVGLYPIAVSTALGLFGVSTVSGDALGWIMWITQTLMVVVFGLLSFIILPFWNNKNTPK